MQFSQMHLHSSLIIAIIAGHDGNTILLYQIQGYQRKKKKKTRYCRMLQKRFLYFLIMIKSWCALKSLMCNANQDLGCQECIPILLPKRSVNYHLQTPNPSVEEEGRRGRQGVEEGEEGEREREREQRDQKHFSPLGPVSALNAENRASNPVLSLGLIQRK